MREIDRATTATDGARGPRRAPTLSTMREAPMHHVPGRNGSRRASRLRPVGSVGDRGSEALRSLGLAPAPRHFTSSQLERLEGHLAEVLQAVGLDLGTASTRDTPRRLLSALIDATDGYEGDPKLVTSFATECRSGPDCELAQIVEGPIAFASLCEHHALPFVGEVWLGYVAHEEILGISKLARLVRVVTGRFSVQERLTHSLADSLAALTGAHGVAVYVSADHMCVRTRGVREHGSRTRTTAYRGVYERDATLRTEFREIAGIGRAGR